MILTHVDFSYSFIHKGAFTTANNRTRAIKAIQETDASNKITANEMLAQPRRRLLVRPVL